MTLKCYRFHLLLIVISNITSVMCNNKNNNYENKPLFLTKYLSSNNTQKARKLAEVNFVDFQNVESYSGYLTVDKKFDSNLFFWFFPSEDNYLKDPVLLWLQGGPGLPSMYGLFEEHGPFKIVNDTVSIRDYRWSKNQSVLYIDNPVGTGFSFTNGGYVKNQAQIGEELHEALVQFFTIFPEIKKNEFFIIAESYAGKYAAALGNVIHKRNSKCRVLINLKGMLINNGYMDPVNQMDYGDYLYQLGFVDSDHKEKLDNLRDGIANDVNNGELASASLKSGTILEIILNQTGVASVFNYQLLEDSDSHYKFDGDWTLYLNKTDVKKAIHVGSNTEFSRENVEVAKNLEDDNFFSVIPWVTELLNHYSVLFFNGQLDFLVHYPQTINVIKNLNYCGAEEYKRAKRYQWKIDNEVAGYCKKGGLLYECLVRNAGHLVPFDQPKYAYNLVYNYIRNASVFSEM